MSEMDVEQLYQEAMLALETENTRKAIDLLKQVVEQDPERVDAWTELSKLMEDRDEKRIALTTILQLDPDNAYASAELQAVESSQRATRTPDDEIVPGIKRSEARRVGIGLAVFTLVTAIICCVALVGASGRRASEAAVLTQAVAGQTTTQQFLAQQSTNEAAEQTAEAMTLTAAFFQTVTPTFTPSRTPNLPPSRTPTPFVTETQSSFNSGLPKPPATLTGSIYAWGGRDFGGGFADFRRYAAAGTTPFTEVNQEKVKMLAADAQGVNMIYMQSITGGWVLARINLTNVTVPELLSSRFANQDVLEPSSPSQSADGTKLVFIARSQATGTTAVYLVDFVANNALRLTSDTANYTGAAISPDGTLVVAARNDGTATDLVLINAADAANSFPQIPVTSDGNTSVEAHPDFSPDGSLVAFSYTQGNPQESNLALVRVAGGIISAVEPIMTVDGDDIYPQFSPDGVYVAFASNRAGGIYNLYIYDRNTRATYQLTEEDESVFPGAWTP